MTASSFVLLVGFTYCFCNASFAVLLALNKPVNVPFFGLSAADLAAPAADQAPCEVTSFMNWHMPPALGEFFGIANAAPVAMDSGLPSLPLNGTADRSDDAGVPASTLTYHCSKAIEPSWSLA